MRSEDMGVDRPRPRPHPHPHPNSYIPTIDFSEVLEARSPEGVREQVMGALTSVGCFRAVYPPVGAELRRALFGEAVRGLRPSHVAPCKWKPCLLMVRRMVLESLGLLKYHEDLNESTWYLLRLAEYGAPHTEEKRMGYYSHQDTNTLTIVCQDHVGGLEVQTKDGQWIHIEPSQTSFIVMAGDALRAWTNGRVYAPFHRVWMGGEETRYSVTLFSNPQKSQLVQAPEELVDENHPALFKPYDYNEYLRFCLSEVAAQIEDKLMAFCGASKTEVAQA